VIFIHPKSPQFDKISQKIENFVLSGSQKI